MLTCSKRAIMMAESREKSLEKAYNAERWDDDDED